MADAYPLYALLGADHRRRDLSILLRGRHQAAGLERALPVLERYNILILTIACIICIEEPRLRGAERVTADDHADIRYGDETRRFAVRDISLSGMLLAGVAPGGLGSSVTVSIAGLSLPAKVTRIKSDQFAVGFETSTAVKSALIRLNYSGRYSAQVTHVRPSKVVGAILSRISR